MLDIVKALLGIDDSKQDETLRHILASASEYILSYCNQIELSDALERIACDISVDVYRERNYGTPKPEAAVTGVSEGAQSVSYAAAKPRTDAEVYASYHTRLNLYRKLR